MRRVLFLPGVSGGATRCAVLAIRFGGRLRFAMATRQACARRSRLGTEGPANRRPVDHLYEFLRSGAMILLLLGILASGCDLFDSTKVDNPIFGPPPPRKMAMAERTGHAVYVDNPLTDKTEVPLSGVVKQTSFTGQKGPEKAAELRKMTGNEIVATVNGQPILASEILERAFPEAPAGSGISLLYVSKVIEEAKKRVADKKMSAAEFQQIEQEYCRMQDAAIRRYLKEYIKSRLLAQLLKSTMEKEQETKMKEALSKMYDEYIDKLKKQMKVGTRYEVDQKLHEQGSSLTSLQNEFECHLLADEYVRAKAKKTHVVGREEIVAYYEEHSNDYNFPEKVRWQLLEVNFEKHGGRKQALEVLRNAGGELEHGQPFDKVARKYSDGPRADEGGEQHWTNPDSVADVKTAATLRELPVGETSPVLRTKEAYRLIRVVERKPAGRQALSEVQEKIRLTIEEKLQKEAIKKVIVEAYQHASIETPYLAADEIGPPAEIADLPARIKKPRESSKKVRDRS